MNNKLPKINVPNALASDSSIAGVYENVNEEFKMQMRFDQIYPKPLLVCSGGTTSRSAANNLWSLDLRKNFNFIEISKDRKFVEIGTGVIMESLIKKLAKHNRSFPIGLSRSTGTGYILTGGISPLSRSEGLAIDNIIEMDGIWGNGTEFKYSTPTFSANKQERLIWRALNGAAPFLAIITKLKLKIRTIEPLIIFEAIINEKQLKDSIKCAENWSYFSSFQWMWGDEIKIFCVFKIKHKEAREEFNRIKKDLSFVEFKRIHEISGIQEMPVFGNININESRDKYYSEVIGLLSSKWNNQTDEIVDLIGSLIKNRPNQKCCISSQQLGGVTNKIPCESTSFIHRQAIWKPWITASWIANDEISRTESMLWIEDSWNKLQPISCGIHMAQMHQHLPWNSKLGNQAFGDWLNELKNLKTIYDPNGLLPSFL